MSNVGLSQSGNQKPLRRMSAVMVHHGFFSTVRGPFRAPFSALGCRPTCFNDLAPTANSKRVWRHVIGDYRPRADVGSLPDRNRSHQRRVRADENILTDFGVIFSQTVVVTSNCPGSNIGAGAHLSIADIGQMVRLGTGL